MQPSIRAIYLNGHLHLTEPIDLAEGQEVQLVILSKHPDSRLVLRELLADIETVELEPLDETVLLREIAEAFSGQPPLSETILEERSR
jgi:predicted DNA-binding antitoxin AbrB/MazE fold protein